MDKRQLQKYAGDMLESILGNGENVSNGIAPGTSTPYLRVEMNFPGAESPKIAAGSFTDYVKGKAPLPVESDETRTFVQNIADIIRKSVTLGDGTRLTVEPAISPAAIGNDVSVLVYSDSHANADALYLYLNQNQRAIRRRFEQQFGQEPGQPKVI